MINYIQTTHQNGNHSVGIWSPNPYLNPYGGLGNRDWKSGIGNPGLGNRDWEIGIGKSELRGLEGLETKPLRQFKMFRYYFLNV